MDWTSHSDADRQTMLDAIGVGSLDELLRKVLPERFLLDRPLDLPDGLSELELMQEFSTCADQNVPAARSVCFLGGGAYDHYIPAAVAHLLGRSEFYTAYTPYQAEVAQGTLQTIYEFQSMVCRLFQMEAASASHYDGATALAEGVILALRKTRRNGVVLPFGLNPHYARVVRTYAEPLGAEMVALRGREGVVDLDELRAACSGAAAVVVQHPNYFGLLEPVKDIAAVAHQAGAMVVSSTSPMSLALLEPPGAWGADVATAEGQTLGIPMSLGGPYLGIFAVKKDLVRLIPGRLVARAKDSQGRDGFVLTLQTREQHIRREKATSNICTNQALMALAALIYLSLVGRDGLRRAALNSYRGAHYLAARLAHVNDCRLRFPGDFFNEFALELPVPAAFVADRLARDGILAGPLPGREFPGMDNVILLAVTEKRTRTEIDRLVASIRAAAA